MSNQVEQREQENPHNIDEMPIKSDHFDRRVPFRAEAVAHGHPDQSAQQPGPDNHVDSVHARHGEVQIEQDLRLVEITRVGILKARAGNVMVFPLFVILDVLERQKYQSQDQRQDQEQDDGVLPSEL